MVSTYHRLWRWWPIRATLAVGRVADAGWRRAIGATCPSPNPRNEVHYDEDFHSSGMIVPSVLMSRSGLLVSLRQ